MVVVGLVIVGVSAFAEPKSNDKDTVTNIDYVESIFLWICYHDYLFSVQWILLCV